MQACVPCIALQWALRFVQQYVVLSSCTCVVMVCTALRYDVLAS